MKYKVIAEKQLNKLDDSMKLKIMRYINNNIDNQKNLAKH